MSPDVPIQADATSADLFAPSISPFAFFKTKLNPVPKFLLPTTATISAILAELNDFFRSINHICRLHLIVTQRNFFVWFLIRHDKESCNDDPVINEESVMYPSRPIPTDALIYDTSIGEIKIRTHLQSMKIIHLYRRVFGKHVFGDKNFFCGKSIFTLEPLRRDLAASLACSDIAGMQGVRLTEIELAFDSTQHRTQIHRANDLFAAFKESNVEFPRDGHLNKARFRIILSGDQEPRDIEITSGNRALLHCSFDLPIVGKWLNARGFLAMLTNGEEDA